MDKAIGHSVFREILEQLPTPIFVKDDTRKFVFMNAACRAIYGLGKDSYFGKSDEDLYDPVAAASFAEGDKMVLTGGTPLEVEEAGSNSNGSTNHFLTRKARLNSTTGEVFLVGTNTDLNKIKLIELRYRVLSETAPVGILSLTEEDGVIETNRYFSNQLGLTSQHCTIEQLASSLRTELRSVFSQQGSHPLNVVDTNGIPHAMLAMSSGWYTLPGESTRVSSVCTIDITEIHQLKQQNEEIEKLNLSLNESLGQLRLAQSELVNKGKLNRTGFAGDQ